MVPSIPSTEKEAPQKIAQTSKCCKTQAKGAEGWNEYAIRFNTAFKEATNLVANGDLEPVDNVIATVNFKYSLDGKQKVARSTVYCAVKERLAGKSPLKRPTAHDPCRSFEGHCN